jgi:glutamate synthase (ferredoxin)
MLVGYGAHAVCPYLAFESCRQWRVSPRTENLVRAGKVPDVSAETATVNYKKALEKGILKILSKMGISLLSCYHGAQVSLLPRRGRAWPGNTDTARNSC